MVDARKLRSYADRILSLKEEEDEIKKSIRQVYADAAEEDDVDKTGLGSLVTYLRKRGKDSTEFDAKEAIFLGYLELYNADLSRAHAYARARGGEIIETNSHPSSTSAQVPEEAGEAEPSETLSASPANNQAETPQEAAGELVAPGLDAADHGTDGNGGGSAGLSAGGEHESVVDVSIDTARQSTAAEKIDDAMAAGPGSSQGDGSVASVSAVETGARDSEPEPAFPPAVSVTDDRGQPAPPPSELAPVVTLRTHNPETHFITANGLVRLHGCQKPEGCASGQPRVKLCFGCSTMHDGPTHQEASEGRTLQ